MARILFFGRLGEIHGPLERNITSPTPIETLRAELDHFLETHGDLTAPTVQVAVNGEIVDDTCLVSNTDEIAFLPPVGGG